MSQGRSEYLDYLPPFLGEFDPDATELGEFLLIFQKILTGVGRGGVEDDHRIVRARDGRAFEPLEWVIDQLDRLFDPARTDARLLPWLASWVGLELRPDWTPAERRRMIARMVRVVRRVGLKAGLHDFLDIYATEEIRPRVAIDDDEALFRMSLGDDGTAGVDVLAFAQRVGPGRRPLLFRPSAVAVVPGATPDLVRYAVADAGSPGEETSPALWLLTPTGELDDAHWEVREPGQMPVPTPLNADEPKPSDQYESWQLTRPVALAADRDGLLVLEQGYRFSDTHFVAPKVIRYPARKPATVGVGWASLRDVDWPQAMPVAMATDPGGGKPRLVVLERKSEKDGTPRLRIMPLGGDAPTIQTIPLGRDAPKAPSTWETPTAILCEAADTYLIADARDRGPDEVRPGTLIRARVDPATGKVVDVVDVLAEVQASNPLVYPTALIAERPGVFLVADRGTKMDRARTSRSIRLMAEPAGLFRVDLGTTPPRITPLTERGVLSWPTGLARDQATGAVLLTDQGEAAPDHPDRVAWRGEPHLFGVSVLQSARRLDESLFAKPNNDPAQAAARRRAIGRLYASARGIRSIIERLKPLHTRPIYKSET